MNWIINILNPPKPTLSELANGLCVLPAPRKRHEAPKQEAAPDLYVIDEAKAEFGFHSATAQRQANGGVPELTSHDITLLMERGYWGAPKNKDLHSKNATCKKCWHGGKTDKEAAVITGRDESWVQKRYGTFATALLQETSESETTVQIGAEKK